MLQRVAEHMAKYNARPAAAPAPVVSCTSSGSGMSCTTRGRWKSRTAGPAGGPGAEAPAPSLTPNPHEGTGGEPPATYNMSEEFEGGLLLATRLSRKFPDVFTPMTRDEELHLIRRAFGEAAIRDAAQNPSGSGGPAEGSRPEGIESLPSAFAPLSLSDLSSSMVRGPSSMGAAVGTGAGGIRPSRALSLIHISEPTRPY